MSRDSTTIAFFLASLKDVEIRAADIGNTYLNAKCREKIWIVTGTEFVSGKVKFMLVVRELYGLNSSGAVWRQMMAQALIYLGYISYKSDPDVWFKAETKLDGTE